MNEWHSEKWDGDNITNTDKIYKEKVPVESRDCPRPQGRRHFEEECIYS